MPWGSCMQKILLSSAANCQCVADGGGLIWRRADRGVRLAHTGTDHVPPSLYDGQMKRILLSWSSGKDSAWALHVLRQSDDCEIVGLLTTVNSEFDRVAMHGTRRSVLEAQTRAAGLPLWAVPLPWPCSNDDYEQRMRQICERAINEGVSAIAFGDLFLQDIRAYRETQLQPTGLEPLFPLWNFPTAELACDMIAGGLRAKLTCVDTKQLPETFVGREFDAALLQDLPSDIAPLR